MAVLRVDSMVAMMAHLMVHKWVDTMVAHLAGMKVE